MTIAQRSEEYLKHFALNIGQALQGIRYLYSHPDADRIAQRGSLKHFALSLHIRTKRVMTDLFFAVAPPHWHHTPDQLAALRGAPMARWFQYGYCAWRFTDGGEVRTDLSKVDRRWDPRCQTTP